jgi:chemotaxis protein CheC
MTPPQPALDELEFDALTELEFDALTELVNLGMSHAAVSLGKMIGQEVVLSVPRVALIGRSEAIEILGKNGSSQLVAVHQVFEGDINGRILLIFPETRSLELVRAITSPELSLEDIIELEQEALAETGNIILNGCLATIANQLQRTLKISLPEILRGGGIELFNLPPPPRAGDVVLFIYINFHVEARDVQGYLTMLMDLPSLEALRNLLVEFIRRTAGDVVPASRG